jgi:hypothetical protein
LSDITRTLAQLVVGEEIMAPDESEISDQIHSSDTRTNLTTSDYDKAADQVEASFQNAAPEVNTQAAPPAKETYFGGLSLGIVSPAGGYEAGVGFFMDKTGSVGDYFSHGPALGYLAAASACIVAGKSDAFSGQSLSTSAGLGPFTISASFDPTTGAMTGRSVAVCLAVGEVRASVSSTQTTTSEFDTPQRIYQEILDFIGYSSPGTVPLRLF